MAKKVYIQDIELTGGSGGEVAWDDITDKPTFADVATSGDYEDLENKPDLNTKQDTLVSGENIKTVNNMSLLGSGNIDIIPEGAFVAVYDETTYSDLKAALDAHIPIMLQIPFLNRFGQPVIRETGNKIELYLINADRYGGEINAYILNNNNLWKKESFDLQKRLASGTNIKTVNNESLLGPGNIEIEGGGAFVATYDQTSYTDVKDAIDANKPIVVDFPNNKNLIMPTYCTYAVGGNITMYGIYKSADEINTSTITVTPSNAWSISHDAVQPKLTSGDNIKTINNESLLGSGNIDLPLGDLTTLTTEDQSSLVAALNEVYEKCGEPFRVKQWLTNTINVEIPVCTEDIGNTSIPKLTFTIDAEEGALYQIVGMIAYEVFDAESGGGRINCWPVCQFTGNGQKELGVRFMCAGTTRKTAKRISAWVLLKRRA